MDSSALIDISQLNVYLGSKHILRDLSVRLWPGSIGLLGPNGAGKSTLIKTLMGFIKPYSGDANVFGFKTFKQGPEIRQLIGYMPEEDTYIPGMTAVQFVSYCGRLCGLPANEAILRAHQVLHYCGLGEARYRKVDGYSTGMRQRIKLAQALVHDPKLLLLDEPTNGLDPQGRKDLLNLIKDISENKGISVLLCSHLLHDVETVCDQVMVLFQGKIVESGRIKDLKQVAQTAYEVRIKGDIERFRLAVMEQEGDCVAKRDSVLKVVVGRGRGPEAIFEAARKADSQVRHLALEEMTLQEVFSSAIMSGGNGKPNEDSEQKGRG